MNLKAKLYEEHHLQTAQQNLAARISLLKTQDTGPPAIQKDVLVRKLKADIRKANRRLKQVTIHEKLLVRKLQEKEEKAAAKKQAGEPGVAPVGKKAAAKTEKKEKKPKEKKPAAVKQE